MRACKMSQFFEDTEKSKKSGLCVYVTSILIRNNFLL